MAHRVFSVRSEAEGWDRLEEQLPQASALRPLVVLLGVHAFRHTGQAFLHRFAGLSVEQRQFCHLFVLTYTVRPQDWPYHRWPIAGFLPTPLTDAALDQVLRYVRAGGTVA